MESGVLKIIKWRPSSQSMRILFPVRAYSNKPDIRKKEENRAAVERVYPNLLTTYWNEHSSLKKQRKEHSFPIAIKSVTDFIKFIQDFKNCPGNFRELYQFMVRRRNRINLINQKFLPKREYVLKPDLAAAHFIVHRGGSIRFAGQPQWIGLREETYTLPITYIPGIHVEAINAERTGLCYEGLENLRKLQYLKYLSLSDLEGINDWCLDWVSKEYYATLKHLDISKCRNVTYRGLSCFYRFECLKSLNLEGVPDTPEMKLACLMLLEIMPNLDIKGIDLSIPDKVDPVNLEETKHLSEETKLISENAKPDETIKVSKISHLTGSDVPGQNRSR